MERVPIGASMQYYTTVKVTVWWHLLLFWLFGDCAVYCLPMLMYSTVNVTYKLRLYLARKNH